MIKLSCCIPGGSLMPEGVAGVPESPVSQIVSKCRFLLSAGYDCTECAGGMLAGLSDDEIRELAEENDRDPLGLVAVNSLFPGDWKLAHPDADRTPFYARADRIFGIMEKLGASFAVFGSGGARSLIPEKENSCTALYDFVKELGKLASSHGVTLVIEPLRRAETNVFVTVPEAGDAIREMNDPNVLLLYDSFHMAEEGVDLGAVRNYADLLRHCHIAEAPKRSVPGSEDSGDLSYNRRFARELIRAGYDGAVSIECGFKDFKTDAVRGLAYMKEIFKEITTVEVTPARDCREEPVYIPVKEGAVPPIVTSAKCGDRIFPASAMADGVLVILTAKRGETLTLTFSSDPVPGAPNAELLPEEHKVEVTIGGHLFSEYVFDPAIPKPFFGQVKDDRGNPFTRLDLTVKEHPHQRSVFIAVGDVNGVDCWNETPNHGYVRNEGIESVESASAFASFTANNLWTDHDGKPLLRESTRYTVYNQSEECRALDLAVTFRADFGTVNFGPTKEAGPLGIRMRDELREDIGCGVLSNSWGGVGEGECWSRSAEWCDYAGTVPGVGPMGVTVFDNEKNERFPTAWHIRSYGLFAANNLYFKGGLTIPAGESLTYRFRILFRRREMTRDELSDRFVQYTVSPRAE
ncbi:MAG: hypothetical protein E7576_02925 [Ruminococcaceae bacterium]|nr:hypothetical protein [Oscillospiraceae bacterium]